MCELHLLLFLPILPSFRDPKDPFRCSSFLRTHLFSVTVLLSGPTINGVGFGLLVGALPVIFDFVLDVFGVGVVVVIV